MSKKTKPTAIEHLNSQTTKKQLRKTPIQCGIEPYAKSLLFGVWNFGIEEFLTNEFGTREVSLW